MGAPKSKHASRRGRASKPTPAALTDRLAEAAWSDADAALAEALRNLDEVRAAKTRVKREVAMEALELALNRAARRRGLARIGVIGDDAVFDAALHEVAGAPAESLQIFARGVRRSDEVLIRALGKKRT